MTTRRLATRSQATIGAPFSVTRLALVGASALTRFTRAYAAPVLGAAASVAANDYDTFTIKGHEKVEVGSTAFYYKLVIAFVLVGLGACFAGLTLGLLSQDSVNLQVLSTAGEEQERKDAAKVLKLLERGKHWVLVVLLLSNVIVNESLPIFLDSVIGGGVGAVVISTGLIVIFGEIIPQAVCARYGLRIGAIAAPAVLALMYLEYPIAYPIAKLLDYLLGESHGTLYKKAELKTFVALHRRIGGESLNEDEVTIISSVLELSAKPVSQIMTNLEDTYSLPSDAILDQETVDEILALGHSRIPVHTPEDPTDFIGMIIVKKLISYDPSQAMPVSTFPLSVLPETSPESTCLDALNYFQQGRSHILLVSSTPGTPGGAQGVVTLEDVIEEMIGEEIVDETDLYVDLNNKIKVVRGPAKRVATGKALAPLIAGVIERRHARRQNTSTNLNYGTNESTPNGASPKPPHPKPNPAQTAFDKVKLRNGKLPDRRQRILDGASPSLHAERSGSPSSMSGLDDETSTLGERKPLLGRNQTTAN
ncbi:BZ3500_MvSof-1268-A1-R1_Chr9g10528 [Microbotryum saponariae]|uniref:BZ3500_MvSof-1268-A1-R1_Chr9g10528 protein n=1 Tax=Microbotryum saponariae TaxID=289078 RepID=A0A2X0KFW2_9BASI|nr:BZ3501_MvSof-1269-A2-R1_Chr9g10277 [Microbotryum saponariae]SDA00244.1 BZ3500_MvSof-1268-A1-R1_Chr9g10528 [Microbotryum saponariae]